MVNKAAYNFKSCNEIEYFQLDKDKKSIKYKAKEWTSVAVHKITDSDWNDNIEDFLNRHY